MRTIYREIVSALIFSKDGKLLMGKKDPKSGGVYADCWHIPGGGVDENETQLEALRREMLEEVGIDTASCKVALADNKGTGETEKTLKDTGEKVLCKMKFNVYRVDVNKDAVEIETNPSDDLVKLEWVAPTELNDYTLTPPSITLFKRLGFSIPHMLHVFTDSKGNFGDAASVIIDEGRRITDTERQVIARKLNTGETAFINDLASANVSIVHPQGEIDFAGVAALGTAWLLAKLRGKPTENMQGRAGTISAWQDGELTWVRASLATMPPWHHKQLESAEAVERIAVKDMADTEHTMVWAWVDEVKGLVRARTFAADWDIPEAQGNGSGSMMLAAMLGRDIEIKHGNGAVIFARPAPDNCADMGGRVAEEHIG